ncbi:MAG: PASTA domain-containing protein [Candidatus Eisenbacteria bacterium]
MRGLRVTFIALLLAVIAFAGGMLLMDVVMGLVVRKGEVTVVPDVTGLLHVEAARVLEDAHLELVLEREVFDAEADSGVVVMQLPGPGMRVKQGRRISVTVSRGPEWGVVPEVAGERVRQARILLAREGLHVEADAYVPHEEIERDLVIATSPTAGVPAASGEPIRLLVSLGPEPTGFLMPDLTGRELDEVNRHLRLFQLSMPRVAYRVEGGMKGGVVLAQAPLPGERVDRETGIELTVVSP